MSARRPLIGVSANLFAADPQRPVFKNMELHYAEENLVSAIYRAGGVPVVIPDLKSEQPLLEVVERIDGLLLAGGADVSPLSYGRKDFDPRWPGDKVRDDYEIALIRLADRLQRPIFGVCRGLQIMNVAYGGTLWQDISTERPDSLNHRDWELYEQNVHEVSLQKGTWLERLYGKPTIIVNTVHHQGVRELAPVFKEAAHAADGMLEAFEHREGRWIKAVQWHPEWYPLDRQGIDGLELVFKDFIESAQAMASHG